MHEPDFRHGAHADQPDPQEGPGRDPAASDATSAPSKDAIETAAPLESDDGWVEA